jgi:BCD family chlorophyll transporter-like MFS transporter
MLLASTVMTSLVFLGLPALALAMGRGSIAASLAGFGLLAVFGIGVAIHGDAHHSLIAEVTDDRSRGAVISVVWTFLIISTIASAITIKIVMPMYTSVGMQRLYNLTPLIVIGSALLGVLGMERRLHGPELAAAVRRSRELTPAGNPLSAAIGLLRDQPNVRAFVMFVLMSILGIFIQDAILEVFGGEVFNMTPGETASFTSTWGGGVLLGMIVIGLLSSLVPMRKQTLATFGGIGTVFGLGMLTMTALMRQRGLIMPALLVMGLSTGIYNVGALSMMMEMTLEGATGLYMGLWGMAQAFGMGLASIVSGGLHSLMIETGLLSAATGYTAIFGLETVVMLVGVAMLRSVSVEAFRGLTRGDVVRVMEASAAA